MELASNLFQCPCILLSRITHFNTALLIGFFSALQETLTIGKGNRQDSLSQKLSDDFCPLGHNGGIEDGFPRKVGIATVKL